MKRSKLIITAMIAVLSIALGLPKENLRTTIAYSIAGNGMLGLMEQTREKGKEYPKVSLTFDDGPNRKYTPLLLQGLKERGIHATFFLMGKNIEGNEDLVKQIQQDGHLIGNHTYNHVQLNKIPVGKAKEEIEKTSNEIFEITGIYPSYIRPPFGSWRKNLDLSVTMVPVFWDIDTLDWKSQNADSVLKIVKKQVHDGSIILMHDGFQSSVDAALKIVDLLTEEGYDFVTVDRLLVL